jgi:hypothetical protein
LWRGTTQITRSLPWRRMIWHRSQRFLIEADTFIVQSLSARDVASSLFAYRKR